MQLGAPQFMTKHGAGTPRGLAEAEKRLWTLISALLEALTNRSQRRRRLLSTDAADRAASEPPEVGIAAHCAVAAKTAPSTRPARLSWRLGDG